MTQHKKTAPAAQQDADSVDGANGADTIEGANAPVESGGEDPQPSPTQAELDDMKLNMGRDAANYVTREAKAG